jgi:hypothetical protein
MAQTSSPAAMAEIAGTYMQTSVVTPAMMSFLRPVAATPCTKAGASQASIGPGR